jgi:hypothetical protein
MFTSWVMLVVFFVIAIFAANLLVPTFSESGIKLIYLTVQWDDAFSWDANWLNCHRVWVRSTGVSV